ncbi:DUF2851 family protein [Arcicella sp. LKC2W]|uniref:DUF2851 family protein n=1 Tax=Arcicella sp. LKC2W TaxID=2984198 RepID=UPI002B214875|nr:DUF2851 family protein [Arcicella sp. LKC2W]MEA5458773.1 DUF2851 family protein [Arcicella sp. LKC2W]
MNESFLHFLWQFQNFDKTNLQTTDREVVEVNKVGRLNFDSGADFQDARIIIDEVVWAGSVEIHIKSSDWDMHKHQFDASYQNVILHVVWEDDKPILRKDGTKIPTITLCERADKNLLQKYHAMMQSKAEMPCQNQFMEVDDIKKLSMLDKVLMKRLQDKSLIVNQFLQENKQDWEETTYQILAKNFGFKLNAEPFLSLSKNLPLKILQKHRDNLGQIEALIFGVAGFLQNDNNEIEWDDYRKNLRKEFQFLASKYQLHDKVLGQHEWKYLRLRPANFPTVRLAQFAKFIHQNANLFSVLIHLDKVKSLAKILKVKQSDYWIEHYVFGKKSEGKVPTLGNSSVENVVINTVVPLLVAYANQKDNRDYLEKAIGLLEEIAAEENNITKHWQSMGLKIKTAFDSQASIEWYNHFCLTKKCLECNVGVDILRKND